MVVVLFFSIRTGEDRECDMVAQWVRRMGSIVSRQECSVLRILMSKHQARYERREWMNNDVFFLLLAFSGKAAIEH